jgi:hypothetical protein
VCSERGRRSVFVVKGKLSEPAEVYRYKGRGGVRERKGAQGGRENEGRSLRQKETAERRKGRSRAIEYARESTCLHGVLSAYAQRVSAGCPRRKSRYRDLGLQERRGGRKGGSSSRPSYTPCYCLLHGLLRLTLALTKRAAALNHPAPARYDNPTQTAYTNTCPTCEFPSSSPAVETQERERERERERAERVSSPPPLRLSPARPSPPGRTRQPPRPLILTPSLPFLFDTCQERHRVRDGPGRRGDG